MTQEEWVSIIHSYKAGKKQAFEKSLIPFYKKNHFQLFQLTQDKEQAWNVFVESMINFRERFLIGAESLPANINGYFFRTQRNIWVDICRKRNKKRQVQFKTVEAMELEGAMGAASLAALPQQDLSEVQEQEENKLKALDTAIAKLCEKCRALIKKNVYEKVRITELQKETTFGTSYQAIVEKKKRCIKKLTKLFFLELTNI